MMCKVLILGCIAAVILMTAAYGAALPLENLQVAMLNLEKLKDIDNDFLDFYTPNDKRECNYATLTCFLKELKVLEQDVEETQKQHIRNILKDLEDFQDPGFSNPTCKKCESHEKKKFPEFRQEMTNFLQSLKK
ncbi:IL15 protein, partial [Alaudala cheleensis]|nr:IL15 protein [Alaudala cheleensis]